MVLMLYCNDAHDTLASETNRTYHRTRDHNQPEQSDWGGHTITLSAPKTLRRCPKERPIIMHSMKPGQLISYDAQIKMNVAVMVCPDGFASNADPTRPGIWQQIETRSDARLIQCSFWIPLQSNMHFDNQVLGAQ